MNKAEKAALRAQAKQDFLEGMSYRQIASKYSVGIGSVARWAEKDGWETPARKNGTPPVPKKPRAERLAIKVERMAERNAEKAAVKEQLQALAELKAQEEQIEQMPEPVIEDWSMLRDSALLILAKINQRLLTEKPLEPRDIKSLTGALLDLKNQLNALSPRELREQAARLRSLEKQSQEQQAAEPVQVVFVNREWDNAGA